MSAALRPSNDSPAKSMLMKETRPQPHARGFKTVKETQKNRSQPPRAPKVAFRI